MPKAIERERQMGLLQAAIRQLVATVASMHSLGSTTKTEDSVMYVVEEGGREFEIEVLSDGRVVWGPARRETGRFRPTVAKIYSPPAPPLEEELPLEEKTCPRCYGRGTIST